MSVINRSVLDLLSLHSSNEKVRKHCYVGMNTPCWICPSLLLKFVLVANCIMLLKENPIKIFQTHKHFSDGVCNASLHVGFFTCPVSLFMSFFLYPVGTSEDKLHMLFKMCSSHEEGGTVTRQELTKLFKSVLINILDSSSIKIILVSWIYSTELWSSCYLFT